jgi:hypothetical protein
MANYPNNIPDFTGQVGGPEAGLDNPDHSVHHQNVVDELTAIATELGVNPSGSASSVAERLAAIGGGGIEPVSLVSTSTFRIPGVTGAAQNLFTLHNGSASGRIVGVRRLTLQQIGTAAAIVMPIFRAWRTNVAVSTGTILAKHLYDTDMASAAAVVARGASSADGTATAITHAAPTGSPVWGQMPSTMITSGSYLPDDQYLLPVIAIDDPLFISPGETLLLNVTGASVTTHHYLVNCMWNEYSL